MKDIHEIYQDDLIDMLAANRPGLYAELVRYVEYLKKIEELMIVYRKTNNPDLLKEMYGLEKTTSKIYDQIVYDIMTDVMIGIRRDI